MHKIGAALYNLPLRGITIRLRQVISGVNFRTKLRLTTAHPR